MSSLIPQERGFLWSIKEVVYGDEEKGRAPVTAFIREVENYPGLLDIIIAIEGLVNKRSSHASGVILYDKDPFETAAFMKTPSGDLITCYDLHKAEAAGDTKYDFLVTEISDKIIICLNLLQEDGLIPKMKLRECYEKYLHPEVLDTKNPALWTHLAEGDILDVFQFCTGVGLAIAKKLKPQDPLEMTAANAMMRLMSEKGTESQQDRYIRIKTQGLQVFDKEMMDNGIPVEMRKILHESCDKYYGCCAIQEQMMMLLMDCANFTLGEANAARKVVAKKQMDKIPQLRNQVLARFSDEKIGHYFWKIAVEPQLGYAFSMNHSLPYSFVGIQSIELATRFNPIYWNTACLIVNSGATDPDSGGQTDYGKIAQAMGDIMNRGIRISLVDINYSDFGFKPDAKNNQIFYGMKSMINVGDDLIKEIITNRPYISIKDFYQKVKPNKQAMITLIKGGAFDKLHERKIAMAWYIWETCDKKSRLTLQNMPSLIKYDLLPTEEEYILPRRIYEFNRYLKAMCKLNENEYKLDERAISFLSEINLYKSEILNAKEWDKTYQKYMDKFRAWLSPKILKDLNERIFLEDWNKYASGNYSKWEMDALCFYYNEHELSHMNFRKYGIVNFNNLPRTPIKDTTFAPTKNGFQPFKLYKICGTCIAKNKNKSIIALLTPFGVVNVKLRKEYFAMFDKRISEIQPDGTKKVLENSWFQRGSKILIQGFRSEDDFILRKYSNIGMQHELYKIESINEDGEVILTSERKKGYEEEEYD